MTGNKFPVMKHKFVIIDGNALLHRAWHAIPDLKTKDGTMVNALYGWLMIFFKMYKDLKPEYIAITFDLKGPTFRHEEYSEYKAQRKKQPDELYDQLPYLKEMIEIFNIPIYEKKGFEADDVIGTICDTKQVDRDDVVSIIVTGDLDTLQLVDNNTWVYTLKKGLSETIEYKEKQVKLKYGGLRPDQLIDYKALRGDPSDNIPGVPGIGEKTAIDLISKYKTLDNLYKQLEKDPENLKKKGIKDRIIGLLQENKKQAQLSKKLVTIKRDVKVDFNIDDCKLSGYDKDKAIQFLQEFEFKSLVEKLPEFEKTKPVPKTQPSPGRAQQGGLFDSLKPQLPQNYNYILVDTDEAFNNFYEYIKTKKEFAFDTETDGLDQFEDNLLGMSFCSEKGKAFYVINKKEWLKKLKPILENSKIKKFGHNIKFDMAIMAEEDIHLQGLAFDTMVASYLINPGSRAHKLDSVVFNYLGHQMIPIEDLIGKKGKNQKTMDQIPVEDVSQYACEDADFTFQLVKPLKKELEKDNNLGLFEKIEIPLIPVLYEMEKNGALLDVKFLNKLSKKVTKDLDSIDKKIYKLAGQDFNINSPLQLQEILFDKLEIPTKGIKKTKTGYSTGADELEKLKDEHPIIDLISQHRELAKLKSTYIDALPELVNSGGRIHTSFNQTVTATGRLSSTNPNVQNIPIRTELGNEIRKSFIAPPGYKIIAADYSQIELRVIASLARDKVMLKGFNAGEDIHKRTAAEIFEIPLDKVSKEQRYAAKAINFGVLYGQGSNALAKSVGISRQEAKDFIEKYFTIHSGIKNYIEQIKETTREDGFIETLFGRRRYIPDINSTSPMFRSAAERMAVNAPIQGTAADLIKLAMIEVYKQLPKEFPKTKIILQVHDELVFEVPENKVKKFAKFIREIMNNVYTLRAPITTDVEYGDSWGEMEKI